MAFNQSNKTKIIGCAVIGIVVLIFIGSHYLGNISTNELTFDGTFTISKGNWIHLGASLDQGESYTVEYSCTQNVNAYLMNNQQFQNFVSSGNAKDYLQEKTSKTGTFSFTQSISCYSDACNVMVVFIAIEDCEVTYSTTETII